MASVFHQGRLLVQPALARCLSVSLNLSANTFAASRNTTAPISGSSTQILIKSVVEIENTFIGVIAFAVVINASAP